MTDSVPSLEQLAADAALRQPPPQIGLPVELINYLTEEKVREVTKVSNDYGAVVGDWLALDEAHASDRDTLANITKQFEALKRKCEDAKNEVRNGLDYVRRVPDLDEEWLDFFVEALTKAAENIDALSKVIQKNLDDLRAVSAAWDEAD